MGLFQHHMKEGATQRSDDLSTSWPVRGLDTSRDRIFLSSPIRPHWVWGPAILLLNRYRNSLTRVNLPGHEADQSPPSSAEVKNGHLYNSASPIPLYGINKDNFNFQGMYNCVHVFLLVKNRISRNNICALLAQMLFRDILFFTRRKTCTQLYIP